MKVAVRVGLLEGAWQAWRSSGARPLAALTPERALVSGGAAGAALLAIELLDGAETVDASCVAVVLAVGVVLGVVPAWASSKIRDRRVLVALLLFPAPFLGAGSVGWAIDRAVELRTAIVPCAELVVAVPLALGAATLAKRLLAPAECLGTTSRRLIALSTALAAYPFALLLTQMLPLPVAVAGASLLAGTGYLVLASGVTGPVGSFGLALGLALLLPHVERSYFALRTILLFMALGAGVLAARELQANAHPSRSRLARSPSRSTAVGLAWLLAALGSERLVTHHPHSFVERGSPTGTLSAAIESLEHATDFDHDGHASLFGGHDCAPFDPARSPGAHERPNNGSDDDCADGDAFGSTPEFLRERLALNARPAPVRRDAVLVMIDTLRADAVGPELARFARDGRRFTRAFSTASFTAESLVGILTGELPTAADYRFSSIHDAEVRHLPVSVFAAARRAGYATGMAGGVRGPLWRAFFRDADVARPLTLLTRAEETTETALEVWRTLDRSKPRLLFVHYLELHGSSDEPAYRASAERVDRELLRLFEALGSEPIWIVTGDHGESFGAHGVYGHSTTLYRDALAVPLVVRYPGIVTGEETALTSLVGVAPTLLALIGPEQLTLERGPYFCLGQSNCGDVPAASALEKPASHLHSLILGTRHALHDLLLDRRVEYDLGRDPGELRPLAPGATSRELRRWEELGFVEDFRAGWFAVDSPLSGSSAFGQR